MYIWVRYIKKIIKVLLVLIVSLFIISIYILLDFYGYIPKKIYYAHDFSIQVVKSNIDYNQNGIDDYTDILIGAKNDAINKPIYKSDSYTDGGYPPDNIGVCTDVIWRALKNAGYSLKDMIDEDIAKNRKLYPNIKVQDKNIDFRRVVNLRIFFDRKLEILTNDITKIEEFQPGDIVIFGENYTHIGIISDKRNKKGIPYLIHNSGQPKREEDILEILNKVSHITRHYRFKLKNN